jgi:lambda repressor-like predicted transcriptional regulator
MTSLQQSETADSFLEEIAFRRKVADVLGDAASRREARKRLGLTLRDLARETGLSVASLQWRETPKWTYTRGSVESAAGWKYVQVIAAAKGKHL